MRRGSRPESYIKKARTSAEQALATPLRYQQRKQRPASPLRPPNVRYPITHPVASRATARRRAIAHNLVRAVLSEHLCDGSKPSASVQR